MIFGGGRGESERVQKSPHFNHKYLIGPIGSGAVHWWVCVQNTFETLRFSKAPGGTGSWESWERGSSDKRKKEARDWKEDRDRKREREKCESHTAALIPACVHPCPSQTTRLAYRECVCARVCVHARKRLTENERVHWSTSAHALMCSRFRAIVRLCELSQQERKHMGWRAHAAKHEFSHKTVASRREVFPRTCLKQPMCCWRGEKERDRHHFWEQMEMGNSVCCWIRLDVNGLMGTIFTPHPSWKSPPPKFLLIHSKTFHGATLR